MRDLVPELQGVMETLDDLDLLNSSEIVREARDEIARLRERLEDMAGSLRVELAAKQGAHNEIKILDGALRSAVRRLDEGREIKPESQAHGDMRDALT